MSSIPSQLLATRFFARNESSAVDVSSTNNENQRVTFSLRTRFWRLITTPYSPEPTLRTFDSRTETQENSNAQVTVAVLDAAEAARLFGVPLARRGIQPVYLRIVNRSDKLFRLQLVRIDPNYYPPLEAAAANHFSIVKRLSAFGLIGWLFLPLLLLIPFKLITAYRANRRMDEFFRSQAFHLRPIEPGGVSEGFVFTTFDAGTKVVHVSLHSTGDLMDSATGRIDVHGTADSDNEFTFSIPVPGIAVDFHRRDFATLLPPGSLIDCDIPMLAKRLCKMPAATGNAKDTRSGDPVNLVVVGEFEMLIGAFAARWDESEVITLGNVLENDALVSPRIALSLFAGQRALFIWPQPGRRVAAQPAVDQRAPPSAALAHAIAFPRQERVGRSGQPRYRRPLYDQDVEPDDPPRRPRCRRSPRLRDRGLAASRAGRRHRIRRRRRPMR